MQRKGKAPISLLLVCSLTFARACNQYLSCADCVEGSGPYYGGCVWNEVGQMCASATSSAVTSPSECNENHCCYVCPVSGSLSPYCMNTCSFPARPSMRCPNGPSPCCYPNTVGCSWYTSCLENYNPCGYAGYAMNYGKAYCEMFRSADLTEDERTWSNGVMLCLQRELFGVLGQTLTCEDIRSTAFASHPPC